MPLFERKYSGIHELKIKKGKTTFEKVCRKINFACYIPLVSLCVLCVVVHTYVRLCVCIYVCLRNASACIDGVDIGVHVHISVEERLRNG